MQRVRVAKLLSSGLLLVAAGCAKPDRGLMGYPKFRSRPSPGGTSREMPNQPPPQIVPETYYAAGRVFEQQGAMDKAIEQYRKAVVLNHSFAAGYERLGLVLSITKRHEEALEAFTKAVELKSDSAVFRNNLGFELVHFERWSEAERHLREAVRIDPRLTRAHINLALLLARTERFEEALDSFRRALPEPDAYYNLGLVLRAQKRYDQAAEAFRHVLSINAEFTAARQQLAQIEERIKEVEEQNRGAAAQPVEEPTVTAGESEPSPKADVEILMPTTVVEPLTAAAVEPPAEAIVEAEVQPSWVVEQLETPANAPEFTQDIAAWDWPQAGGTLAVAATPTETTASPAPKQATTIDWGLTLKDIARALSVVENDRRCAEEAEARAAAEREAEVQAARAALDAQEAQTVSMKLASPPAEGSASAAAENRTVEVVLVLPAAETRETAEVRTQPSGENTTPTGGAYDRTWEMMRDLEESIEIIRNEVDCRKSEEGSADITTAGEGPTAKPVSFDERTLLWNATFGELEGLLSIARNEDYCLVLESMAARERQVANAIAAALPFIPAPLMALDAARKGADRAAPCEPTDEATARSADLFGLRSQR